MQDLESWQIDIRRAVINHSELDCLWRYRHQLLTWLQSDLLNIVMDKIERNKDWFGRKEQCYSQSAGLVLMSRWHRAIDFITCMVEEARVRYGLLEKKEEKQERRYNRALNCRYWRLCDHCAWRREMDLQCRFLKAFNEGIWVHITASFVGNLPMQPGYLSCNGSALSHCDLTTYWDSIRFAIGEMVGGVVRGAVLVEELHLESLYPVPLVTPHSHVVALVDNLPSATEVEHMKTLMLQYQGRVWDLVSAGPGDPRWDKYHEKRDLFYAGFIKTRPRKPSLVMVSDPRLTVELPISIDMQPLAGQKDFSNVLGYLAKPFELANVYKITRDRLIRENRDGLEFLAQNVSDFLVGADALLTPRRCPAYYGACDARRPKQYLGAPGWLLLDKDHRFETKALLAKLHPKADPSNNSAMPGDADPE